MAGAATGIFLVWDFWPSHFGALDPALRFAPTGTAWAVDIVPVSGGLFDAALLVFLVACIALLIGFQTRPAAWTAALLSVYVGWVPALTGKVDHYHNVVWFLLVLALAPSGDAWSVDERRRLTRGEPTRHEPLAYAAPLATVSILIGVIYLGAGLKKLSVQGFEWASENALVYAMYNQAWEKNFDPRLWITEIPGLASAASVAVLAFELLFVVAILFTPSRKVARWIGLLFHWGTFYALGIGFWWLQGFYVVFFDWSRFERRPIVLPRKPAPEPARVAMAVVFAVITGVSISGSERSWPVASYPGFEQEAVPRMIDFEFTTTDGRSEFLSKSEFAERVRKRRVNWLATEAFNAGVLDALVGEIESSIGSEIAELAAVEINTLPDQVRVAARMVVWSRPG